jgi:hypothetical protein
VNVPSAVIPQLVLDALLTIGVLWYLPRALRGHKNRFVLAVLLAWVAYSTWENLHGVTIDGFFQGGGQHAG